MTDNFSTSNVTGIPLNPPVRIKIGMVWKKSKYISGDMLTFLHFTRMYYKEHPLIENNNLPDPDYMSINFSNKCNFFLKNH